MEPRAALSIPTGVYDAWAASAPPSLQERRTHAAARPRKFTTKKPREWVDAEYLLERCKVSSDEWDKARAAARKDLLSKKKPVPAGQQPHLIVTIGAPGAGKSTVAAAVARSRGRGDYVTIDVDVAVKYHPRYFGMWNVPNVATGKPTGIGVTSGYWTCNAPLEDILIQLYEDILHSDKDRYNIILQSHSQINLIGAKLAGYRTTLLFVGVPLETAVRRSRSRAIETGKFLTATLGAQDQVVFSMWVTYRDTAAWYGLWADEFLVANNSREGTDSQVAARAGKTVQEIPLRCTRRGECGSWEDRMAVAQRAIDEACGGKPAKARSRRLSGKT